MDYLEKLPYSSIVGALEHQARSKPDNLAVLYPDPQTNYLQYASLTYRQYHNVTNHLAEKLRSYLPNSSSNEPLTCALLLVGGLEYLLSQYALLKLDNVIMFPISARNSPAAIEHLLRETKTCLLLTTSQYAPMIKTIRGEREELQALKVLLVDSEEFAMEDLLEKKDLPCSLASNGVNEINRVVIILHSSGSTAHPKPIYLTNRYFLIGYFTYMSINPNFWQETDVVLVWGALFHLLAFTVTIRAILTGCAYALPLGATFPPKPDELVHNIQVNNGITVLVTVPSLLEQLIRELLVEKNHSIGLKPLQKLKFVMYGGAGCPDELCKTLVDNDVVLLSVYGSTETGVVLVKNFNPYDKRWKYMQLSPIRKPFVRIETPPDSQNPNEKIFIHSSNDPFLAEKIGNTPDGSYLVGDILLEDPPNSGYYRILGRHDDTLVHITGEKTNPVPIENTIQRSPFVKHVVIIGHNQFCTAALIELNVEASSKEIEENIWKFVEEANREAPSHSRVVRPLVHILGKDQVLPVTHKGNLMRQRINQDYSQLISEIYDRFLNEQYQQRTEKKVKQVKEWTKESIRRFLREKLPEKIDDGSKSIFELGINSLQIVELRSLICEEICQVPKNFLYEYSSLDQMTEKLWDILQHGWKENEQKDDPFHYQLTEQILEKYIQLIESNPVERKNREGRSRVFLLTGANGSLGCFTLRDLLAQSEVKRVYALLRGTNTKERLFQAFQERQLDLSILTKALDEQRLIIFSSSMNLTDEHLGLTEENYKDLENQLTDIIHSAWKMNFNQTIQDFEKDSILGVYHLLKLASSNAIQFHFISSISSAASGLLNPIKEQPLPRQVQIALPQGYGQSKYVSEHLCWTAQQIWNVPVTIFRVGQISGDTRNGIWNSTELAAMMIYAGAGQLHRMPNVGHDLNWIPVDFCSGALVELALKSSSDQHVYHLLNPHVITYEEYLQSLRQAGLTFETVEKEEFLREISQTTDRTNPLIKLSPFLEQMFTKTTRSKAVQFETNQTVQHSHILQTCPPINSTLIKQYLDYWKKCQLIKDSN